MHRLNPDQLSSGNLNLNCFTEGSKTEVSTGASHFIMGRDEHFPCFKRQESIHLGPFFTVFQSETSAIARVTLKMIEENINDRFIRQLISY